MIVTMQDGGRQSFEQRFRCDDIITSIGINNCSFVCLSRSINFNVVI